MRALSLLAVALLGSTSVVGAQSSPTIDESAIRERAALVIELMSEADEEGLAELWSPAIIDELPPDQLLMAWATVGLAIGRPVEVPEATVNRDEDGWVAEMMVQFQLAPLPISLMFDANGLVRGVAMGG